MKEFFNRIKVRLLAAGILVTCLFLVPAVTQAQYKWLLNGFITVSAGEDYFGSNVLRDPEENAFYPHGGWNGLDLSMPDLEIYNYINALLANKDTDPVHYTLQWTVKTYDKNGNEVTDDSKKYALLVKASGDETQKTPAIFGKISGTLRSEKSEPVKHSYKVSIIAPEGAAPESGDYVKVIFYAENTREDESQNRFNRDLRCEYQYTVNLSKDFIQSFDAIYAGSSESKSFNVELGTKELPSIELDYETVIVWWRPQHVEINPYNFSFLTYSATDGAYTPREEISTLKISGLGSNKYRPLGFFVVGEKPTSINDYVIKNAKPDDAAADGKWIGCYLDEPSQDPSQSASP